nr:PqqD family protein [Desulfobacula sp.]
MTGKKKKAWTKQDALLCIPEKNTGVEELFLDGGDLVLSFPVTYKPFFMRLRRFLRSDPKSTFRRKIQLDRLGADVWSLLDGKRDVKTVIREFAGRHGLDNKEAEISVTHFLRSLGQKGLIRIRER